MLVVISYKGKGSRTPHQKHAKTNCLENTSKGADSDGVKGSFFGHDLSDELFPELSTTYGTLFTVNRRKAMQLGDRTDRKGTNQWKRHVERHLTCRGTGGVLRCLFF